MRMHTGLQLPDHAFTTYGIVSPRATHTRPARCEEIEADCMSMLLPDDADGADPFNELLAEKCTERHCGPWAHGWVTLLDTSIPAQRELAKLVVKNDGGRHWTAKQNGHLVEFTFPAGQQCFAAHRVPIGRPPIFTLKRGKEFRADGGHYVEQGAIVIPGARRVRGEEWIERCQENVHAVTETIQKG